MTDQEKYADKIAKLLAKAESTNVEEAEALIAKAQELMTKYAIDQAMLESVRRARGEGTDLITEEEFVITGSFRVAFGNLCYYIIQYNDCQAVLLQDRPRTIDGKLFKQTYILRVTGFKSDIDQVRFLYTSLHMQAARFENQWWKANRDRYTNMKRQGFLDRRQFLFSFASTVGARIREGYLRGKEEAEKTHGSGMEMVLYDKKALVTNEYHRRNPNLKSAKQRQTGGSYDSAVAGQAAGHRADLQNPRVGGGSSRKEISQ